MRYLTLALATFFGVLFAAVKVLPSHNTVLGFLSATIELPVSSLATLSYLLGLGTGLFLAIFVMSFQNKRAAGSNVLESGARSST